jgi:hypothetical protein
MAISANWIFRLASVFFVVASSITDAQPVAGRREKDRSSIAHVPALELEAFLKSERCDVKPERCLQEFANRACASGCVRKGYNWTAKPAPQSRPEPHMTMSYLKLLRDAAVESPGYVLRDGLSFGYTLEQLLDHQTQAFLIDESVRYHDDQLRRRSHADVQSGSYGSNTIDPNQFWMVTFGNDAGTPQAMGQGDFAVWLLTVAKGWATAGRAERIDYYLRLSQAAFRAFFVSHGAGGVRSEKNRCHDGRSCYWFHSGNDEVTWPQSVLNKNLNAIRNMLEAHRALAEWRLKPINGIALPAEFARNGHIERLRDATRGGLNQLAYGRGHAADHSRPPNLSDFMQPNQKDPEHTSVQRYNSWYRFDMHTHTPGNGGTEGNVCHYHYYTLQLFWQILTAINEPPYLGDADFMALYSKLLYGRDAGDARKCDEPSVPPSKRNMRGEGHPLAELYYGGRVYRSWPTKSSFPEGHCNDALWFQLPDWFTKHPPTGPDRKTATNIIETRRFFDEAYEGCSF